MFHIVSYPYNYGYLLFCQARYKQSLDPTVEEVKKLCTSLRRNAKVLSIIKLPIILVS